MVLEARPRLCVFRSNKQIYAYRSLTMPSGTTLTAASSLDPRDKAACEERWQYPAQPQKAVGQVVAKRALDKGISAVLFDRGGYIYHGRVKALADAAREAGLKF